MVYDFENYKLTVFSENLVSYKIFVQIFQNRSSISIKRRVV